MGMYVKENNTNFSIQFPSSTHLQTKNNLTLPDEIIRIKHKINEYESFLNSVFEDDSYHIFDIPSLQNDLFQLRHQLSQYELRNKK